MWTSCWWESSSKFYSVRYFKYTNTKWINTQMQYTYKYNYTIPVGVQILRITRTWYSLNLWRKKVWQNLFTRLFIFTRRFDASKPTALKPNPLKIKIQSNPWITSYLLSEFENDSSSSSPPWFRSPGWLTMRRHHSFPSRWKRERLSSDDALAGSLARLWSLSGWRGWVVEIWWNHLKMWRWSFWRWSSSGQRCWRCACRQRRRWWPSPARIFTSSRKAFDKVCSNSDL